MNDLLNYAAQFRNLHVHKTKQHSKAPHKFLVLLTIIELWEQNQLQTPQIHLNHELKQTFEQIWLQHIHNPHYHMNIAMPIYHLQYENFWHIHIFHEKEQDFANKNLMKTWSNLTKAVNFIEIDEKLAQLFQQTETRHILRDVLLAQLWAIK